ncbi:MAG: hypothetical protein JW874_09835 [Spirochaetales bacterium]|nr:hypothetical protein [Spirochaetales bacterium]
MKIQNRIFTLLFVILLVLSFLMMACDSGGNDGDDDEEDQEEEDEEEDEEEPDEELPDYGSSGWNDLGMIVQDFCYDADIAIDPTDDKPIIVFSSEMESYRAHVYKYESGFGTGAVWTDLGYASTGGASWVQVELLADGTPVVAYQDNSTPNHAFVVQYLSGTWTDMGEVSGDEARYLTLLRHPVSGKPVLAFTEYNNGYRKARVTAWESGTSWTDYGFASTRTAFYLSMALDPDDGTPYLSFQDGDNGDKAGVRAWDGGTTWNSLGVPSTNDVTQTGIVIDPADNKPIVLFHTSDVDLTEHAYVRKHTSGVAWGTYLGQVNTGDVGNIKLRLDPVSQCPVTAFIDEDNSYRLHLLRYSDTTYWIDLGYPRTEPVNSFGMTMDRFGRAFLVFMESGYQPRIFFYMD